MALTAAGLKTAIVAQLGSADDAAKQGAFAEAIANAIITYLLANATISVPALGLLSAAPGAPVTGAAVGVLS